MLANLRRDQIPALLDEDGPYKAIDIVYLFKVTEITIFQDLEKEGRFIWETIE